MRLQQYQTPMLQIKISAASVSTTGLVTDYRNPRGHLGQEKIIDSIVKLFVFDCYCWLTIGFNRLGRI